MSIASFDGNTRIMSLNVGVINFTVSLLYSDWKRWTALEDNSKFLPAFRYVGGDPTIPGQYLGSTYFIMNGWKIRPYNADHTLIVDGNLFTEDQSSPFLPALDPHMVAVQMAFSNLTTTIIADSTGTIITPENIASAVWEKSKESSEFSLPGTIGHHVYDIPENTNTQLLSTTTSGVEFNTSGTFANLINNIPENVWNKNTVFTSGTIGSLLVNTPDLTIEGLLSKNLNDPLFSNDGSFGKYVKDIPVSAANFVWSVPVSAIQFSEDGTIAKFITEVPNITSDNVWSTPTSGSEFNTDGMVGQMIKVIPVVTTDMTWNAQIDNYNIVGSIGEYIKNKILSVSKFIGLS